jgi:hypothetical protein
MRNLIAVSGAVIFLLVFGQCSGQAGGVKHSFKEVGWTVTIPTDFKTIDSAAIAALNEKGKKALDDANKVKTDISGTTTLITAMKGNNYFSGTLTAFTPKGNGDYAAAFDKVKDMLYATFVAKMPGAKLDTSSTTVVLDGLKFAKFYIGLTRGGKRVFKMFVLGKNYRGYDFSITYMYLDDVAKGEIESMLASSRFAK